MLPDEKRDLRIAAVAAAVLACAAIRIAGVDDVGPIELLPVLGAAVWFGHRPSLAVSVVSGSVLGAAAIFNPGFEPITVLVRIAILFLVAQLMGTLVERARRQEAEIERMRPLQDVLAPREPARLPLLELASRYITAQAGVSGDFYLVVEGRNTATILVIGDVAGKGMEAARRAIFARATVTACAPYSDDPAHILRTANAELIRQYGPSAHFITMLCVVVHPDATVSWASAGHPPPVSLADGEPIATPRVGYPLGIAPEIPEMDIARGPLPAAGILLYTDGLTDARPPGGTFQPFGEYRIGMFLRELSDPTPEQAVDRLAKAAQIFSGGELPDDLCMVAVRSRFEARWHRTARRPSETQASLGASPPVSAA
jgi:serine phosphatase RsbU (regulator of sigma subunit)